MSSDSSVLFNCRPEVAYQPRGWPWIIFSLLLASFYATTALASMVILQHSTETWIFSLILVASVMAFGCTAIHIILYSHPFFCRSCGKRMKAKPLDDNHRVTQLLYYGPDQHRVRCATKGCVKHGIVVDDPYGFDNFDE